jgi:hypothetical protein
MRKAHATKVCMEEEKTKPETAEDVKLIVLPKYEATARGILKDKQESDYNAWISSQLGKEVAFIGRICAKSGGYNVLVQDDNGSMVDLPINLLLTVERQDNVTLIKRARC